MSARPAELKMAKIRTGKKGNVYLWTGDGWGKTTSALGVALRAVGHKKKVVMVQFMKGRKDVGEYKASGKLKPYFEMRQFGRKEFIDLKNPSEKDKRLASDGLEFAKKALKKKPFLLILDEANIAAKVGLLDVKEIIGILDRAPSSTNVYLTGRYAPKKLMKRADYVTEVKAVKHPPIKGNGKIGIDY
jgi:cob(I)alamin adenosyltransferase